MLPKFNFPAQIFFFSISHFFGIHIRTKESEKLWKTSVLFVRTLSIIDLSRCDVIDAESGCIVRTRLRGYRVRDYVMQQRSSWRVTSSSKYGTPPQSSEHQPLTQYFFLYVNLYIPDCASDLQFNCRDSETFKSGIAEVLGTMLKENV